MTVLQLGGGPWPPVRRARLLPGIPYAAPPVGDRRWRAPAPVDPWEGVLEGPGTPAPQPAQSFSAATSLHEDCRTLDVTVPVTERAGRPVVVWPHGGGGTNGSGADVDPHRLAVTGDGVVVTPSFRLGVFACFGHPDLVDGGTFGLQDQQAVLLGAPRDRAVRREPRERGPRGGLPRGTHDRRASRGAGVRRVVPPRRAAEPVHRARRDTRQPVHPRGARVAADGDPGWPRLPHVQSLAPDRIGPTDFVAGHQLEFWAGLTSE